MPVMAVTRLRLRDPADFDAFFGAAVAVAEQANASKGCLGERGLADANNVFWTVAGKEDRLSMIAFTQTQPHLDVAGSLDTWCDEATFVDWEQAGSEFPTGRPVTNTWSRTARWPRSATVRPPTPPWTSPPPVG
jgi:hypothetical protein